MTALAPYITGLVIGLLTGLFYFGGLWLTVKKIAHSGRPNRLLAFSALVRLLPTLAIMFLLIRRDPGMFVAMLIAFFAVRFVMTRKIALPKDPSVSRGDHGTQSG